MTWLGKTSRLLGTFLNLLIFQNRIFGNVPVWVTFVASFTENPSKSMILKAF